MYWNVLVNSDEEEVETCERDWLIEVSEPDSESDDGSESDCSGSGFGSGFGVLLDLWVADRWSD